MALALVVLLWASVPASAAVVLEHFDGSDTGPTDSGYRGGALAVSVSEGSHWGLGQFEAVPGSPDEAWFRYMLSLDRWEPSQSGKLPGFASLRSGTARGCVPATERFPGWSARMMYRPVGSAGAGAGQSRVGYYVYHLDQAKDCGEILEWNDNAVLTPGQWYCIEGHIRLNDPEGSDGRIEGWVDGESAFVRDDLRFRVDAGVGVDDLWMNVYSGGKQPSPESLRLRLDEVAISTSSRLGCPDAFDDDETDPNEQAMNRLADLGVFQGCGTFLACPDRLITRGDLFGMIAGAVDFAPGPDAFTDDDGHPSEDGIDALAAAGVVLGCARDIVCPDDPISRADAARIIADAFDLPPGENVRFSDVHDPVMLAATAALASAGVSDGGCGPGRFCPDAALTRSQAAALIANAVAQDRVQSPVSGRLRRPTLDEALTRQFSFRRFVE